MPQNTNDNRCCNSGVVCSLLYDGTIMTRSHAIYSSDTAAGPADRPIAITIMMTLCLLLDPAEVADRGRGFNDSFHVYLHMLREPLNAFKQAVP